MNQTDYFPFGMEISSRTTNSDNYRFGYNGSDSYRKESDNETKGSGNSYTTEFRQYDPRIGRWLSLDPLMAQYPMMSPYVAFNNNPMYFVDPLGLEGDPPGGLPKDPKNEQISVADNGKKYQYVIGDDGNGTWSNYIEEVDVVANINPMKYSYGDLYKDSPDHDLSKEHFEGYGLNSIDKAAINDPNDPNDVYGYLKLCYSNACSAGMNDMLGYRKEEGMRLLENFVLGTHKQIIFGTNSDASKDASEDSEFLIMAEKFESAALSHFRVYGNLNQFNGNLILENNKPYLNDSWYTHTIMGGISKITAEITQISAFQISVTYYLWDHFGAGTNDTKTILPGLSAMYHLQHNFSNGKNAKYFTPFVWAIKIKR